MFTISYQDGIHHLMEERRGWEADALAALGEQLHAAGEHVELVVVGSAALLALELVDRVTRDVDVVGIRVAGGIESAKPLPAALAAAARRVARDLELLEDWLNPGPTDLLDFGLPAGFLDRVRPAEYGPHLVVFFASRYDQIHLKLYAMVDQAGGRHEDDLRRLLPTRDELLDAARWTTTHDPSAGFRDQLLLALERLGVDDADLG